MKTGLIGYTGFVGGTLVRQLEFNLTYNSSNIDKIRGESFDLLICAGAPAVKWKANAEPEKDWENLSKLIENLQEVTAKKFVLISTVDVYRNPQGVDEDTIIDPEYTDPYGKHRFYLERFCKEQFDECLIIRLPGLFGKGLKKNFIYDMMHDNCLHLTHHKSVFQFYNLDYLWKDIQFAMDNNLQLVNFTSEPVSAEEVATECFNAQFTNITEKPPVSYDMHSQYAAIFNAEKPYYMYSKEQVLRDIKSFVQKNMGGKS